MELAPFNVDVVIVTVGAFISSLVDKSNANQLDARCETDFLQSIARAWYL